jgi:hypothetical protein
MTGETSEGARRVRVVPRPGPGPRPAGVAPHHAGPHHAAPTPVDPADAGPADAETEVLPRIAPGPGPVPGPGRASNPPPAPRAARRERATTAGDGAADADAPDSKAPESTERRRGLGAPALVLGVLAAGTCWTGWAGVVLGLFAVAAGYLGARRAFRRLATDGAASLGGLALGVVGLVVGVVVVWPTLFGTGNFGDGLTLDQCLQQANGAFQMHLCKSQHITEFNQRFPDNAT